MNKKESAFKEFYIQGDEINYKYYNKIISTIKYTVGERKTIQWLKAETGPNYLKAISSTH